MAKEVVKHSRWDAAKRYAAMLAAAAVIACAVLSIIGCVMAMIALPLILPVFVNSLVQVVLGALMLCIQLNRFTGTVTKYFGFLNLRIGRGLFYLFVGNGALLGAVHSFNLLSIIGFVVFGCCWFVGLFELCGPASRHSAGDAMLDPATGAASTTTQPLAQPDGSITINLTPAQVAAGANFGANLVANNAESAWQAAVKASATGGGASSSQAGGGGGESSGVGVNPFFGAK